MISLLAFVSLPTWLAVLRRRLLSKMHAAPQQPHAVQSILVVRLDQLGDLVLTTPLFRELKRLYPASRCTVVVQPQYKSILTTNPHVDEILMLATWQTKWLPVRARRLASALWFYRTRLRRRQFDLAISPRWDVDEDLATLLCVLVNASRRVGYISRVTAGKRRFNRGFDAAFDVVLPPGPLLHEVERTLAVVEALGGHAPSRRLEIFLSENDRKFASQLLQHHDSGRLLVALGIGSGVSGRKWPLERYTEAVNRLNQLRSVQPVIVCSSDEDDEASALSVQLPVPPYIVSGLPLRAVCAVFERCDLFVGNDSGPAHLAAAMDCPTVVVSRHPANGDPGHANSPVRFAPCCARHRVMQPAAGLGECTASCRAAEPHCILQVTVEQVVEAAANLLPRPAPALISCNLPAAVRARVQLECSRAGVAGLA
jgi:heptosyltransferase-2